MHMPRSTSPSIHPAASSLRLLQPDFARSMFLAHMAEKGAGPAARSLDEWSAAMVLPTAEPQRCHLVSRASAYALHLSLSPRSCLLPARLAS